MWAAPGRDRKTVEKFLDLLRQQRCEQIELVSCDMAEWITRPISERCPNAAVCLDPFHVIKLSTDALDEIRRELWNEAQGRPDSARQGPQGRSLRAVEESREKLTERQQHKLARINQINDPLYRAYLLSQQLRPIYRLPYEQAIELLDAWLSWAQRCRLAPSVKLARTIRAQRPGIEAAIQNGVSNARVEQINTQIRLITRRGSATTHKKPSSPSPCCHSAASAHPFPDGETTPGTGSRFLKCSRMPVTSTIDR